MGLLDDAIREHLELDRPRAPDPGEVERLEREALGPVRRAGYDGPEMPTGERPAAKVSQPDDQPTELWSEASDESDFAHPGNEFVGEVEDWGASDFADTVLEPDIPPVQPMPPPEEEPPRRSLLNEEKFLDEETVERGVDAEYAEDRSRDYPDPRQHGYPEPPDPGHPEPLEHGHPEPLEHGHPEQDEAQPSEQEDMLEETPEFLQDTPDHDRLWFEQRPPRDFDFDG